MTEPALRVGLEVHAPLATATKLHCPCAVDLDAPPNTRICPTCTGQPGAKPHGVNRAAIERTATAARALACTLATGAVMQRKHYVYPDLPTNYQRTSTPIGAEGVFEGVGILEVHVEEDPGAYDVAGGTVDYNRSGAPLVEIVTAPDLASEDDVVRFWRTLRVALDANGVVRVGADLKADVNVSVGDGPRVEVKNVTGARNAAKAVRFEATRQRRIVAEGGTVRFETRHFDEATGMTRASRDKETVAEYRYIPDPDLRPIDVAAVASGLPVHIDMPARLARLGTTCRADRDEVLAVAEDAPLFDALEGLVGDADDPAVVFDFLNRVVRGELNYRKRGFGPPLDVAGLRKVLDAQADGRLTRRAATDVVRGWLDDGDLGRALKAAAGVVGGGDLGPVVADVLAANGKAVADYRGGATGALDFLLGQVMARTRGKADPAAARAALEHALGEP